MQKNEQLLLRIPENLKNTLKESAAEKGYTVNGLITQILWDWKESAKR